MRDPKKNVTFVFKCYEKESADLKIRLRYDGLKQSEFFRTLLQMYISKDLLMMEIVEKIKENQMIMGIKKRKLTLKEIKRGETVLEELGITQSDKRDLFDLIDAPGVEYD